MLAYWYIQFSFDHIEKIAQGDSLHNVFAGFSLKIWNKMGKGIFLYLWRSQYRRVNNESLARTRQRLTTEKSLQAIFVEKSEKVRREIQKGSQQVRNNVSLGTQHLKNTARILIKS